MSNPLFDDVYARILQNGALGLHSLIYIIPADLAAYRVSATALVNATGTYRCTTVPVGALYQMVIVWDVPAAD